MDYGHFTFHIVRTHASSRSSLQVQLTWNLNSALTLPFCYESKRESDYQ